MQPVRHIIPARASLLQLTPRGQTWFQHDVSCPSTILFSGSLSRNAQSVSHGPVFRAYGRGQPATPRRARPRGTSDPRPSGVPTILRQGRTPSLRGRVCRPRSQSRREYPGGSGAERAAQRIAESSPSANTISTLLPRAVFNSGNSWDRWRWPTEPPPAATATYCFPLTA